MTGQLGYGITLKVGPPVISCGWHLFKTSVRSGIRVGSGKDDFCCEPVLVLVHDRFGPVDPGMGWRNLQRYLALLLWNVRILVIDRCTLD